MTFYVENETGESVPFAIEETGRVVCESVLKSEKCPYEAAVNLVLTDNESIRELNRQYRDINRETDVLSFPNLDFAEAGKFELPDGRNADYFDPDTGELMLGDICISVDRMREQATEYGHSLRREFAFLVAHSMLHLCGYDHMTDEEAEVMEGKQEAVLSELGIVRK